MSENRIDPIARVVILLTALAGICFISWYLTGSVLPDTPRSALIFQNALLLIVLGTATLERFYTKPADSMVNGLMGCITLLTVYGESPEITWWITFGFSATVLVLAATCVAASSGSRDTGVRQQLARLTYRPSVELGKARILFSIIFLFGVFSFYGTGSRSAAILVAFWGIFVVLWPLGIPELISRLVNRERSSTYKAIGNLIRMDNPGILRFAIEADAQWSPMTPAIYQQPNGIQVWVLPLYSHLQQEYRIGTGLQLGGVETILAGVSKGKVVLGDEGAISLDQRAVMKMLGEGSDAVLAGFVVEDSEISAIRFEAVGDHCRDGALVWAHVGAQKVYYQITEGVTREEILASDRHGHQVATAAQLGQMDFNKGFELYPWIPHMNCPVFTLHPEANVEPPTVPDVDFRYGTIPGSSVPVSGPFLTTYNFHTAILGVTGSGKTELAFDLVRHAVRGGIKVVCIDLTSQYQDRLSDLNPHDLSIKSETARELNEKLFDVETGKYGAGDEKRALKEFSDTLRVDVKADVESFISRRDERNAVGLIRLEEISNTKATLWITEMYLTCLLHHARDNVGNTPPTLIVVEEAHTVMPEPATMGLGDYDSRGMVGKIAQIALQGRKYNVGLLVLAQRTATVSKTVLSQCNTVISFASYDDTSLAFLRNMFGSTHVNLIPNLRPLEAVMFGKGVRSQRPVIAQIPFDPAKAPEGHGPATSAAPTSPASAQASRAASARFTPPMSANASPSTSAAARPDGAEAGMVASASDDMNWLQRPRPRWPPRSSPRSKSRGP